MCPEWSWNFEEERQSQTGETAAAGTGPPPPSDPTPGQRAAEVRRRRLALVAILLLVGAIALVASLGGSSKKHPARVTAKANLASRTKPPDIEQQSKAAVGRVLAYTPFVKEGSTRVRDIALTFDDGPGPYSLELVKVLEHYHVKATFFEVGEMLRYFSAATEREIKDGDVIGDHTETHPFMADLSAHAQHEELFEQIARIELAGGPRPTLFRPPYGSFNATTMRQLAKLHLLMVLWSVDTEDYTLPGVPAIVEHALAGAKPGAIILMHDGGGDRSETIAALPEIITKLRDRGYRLVTIPRLLLEDPPPHGLPLPPNLSGD